MSRLFEGLREGLGEAITHAKADKSSPSTRVRHFMPSEIQSVRAKTGLTQEQFATVIGSSVATLRKWEQGSRQPSAAAQTLIKVIAYRPSIVKEALGVTPAASKRRPKNISAV
jgi:putative transcriptional regulator